MSRSSLARRDRIRGKLWVRPTRRQFAYILTVNGCPIARASDHDFRHALKVDRRRTWPGRNLCFVDRAAPLSMAHTLRVSGQR